MEKKTIVIIFGGKSSEYIVSLASAYAVLTHIDKRKYEVLSIGITKQGEWLLYEGEQQAIKEDTWMHKKTSSVMLSPSPLDKEILIFKDHRILRKQITAIFPILHGQNGEDGTVQALAKIAEIPIIGCDVLSSALCMDKDRAHALVSTKGIRVPKAIVLTKHEDIDIHQIEEITFPVFIKPLQAGSSVGITKVYQKEEILPALHKAFTYDTAVIIEENIEGFEVGCAIIGTESLLLGEIDEIEISKGFFDFTEKYSLQSSQIHLPARINRTLKEQVLRTAKTIYQTLGCRVFARVDLFITPTGEIVFNEVNTIPGFTNHSRFPNMMKKIGLSFSEIIDTVIKEGL